jgi:hypothetical protein
VEVQAMGLPHLARLTPEVVEVAQDLSAAAEQAAQAAQAL